MARGMPSMLALLGLAALAGYQNRDKIAAAVKDAQTRRSTPGAPTSGMDSILGGIGDLIGNVGQPGGGSLTQGLGGLLDSFKSAGHGAVADSWIKPGPNQTLTPDQVEQAVGADNIAELTQRTGLSRDELLKRLSTSIPQTVDRLTPDGKMPASDADVLQRI